MAETNKCDCKSGKAYHVRGPEGKTPVTVRKGFDATSGVEALFAAARQVSEVAEELDAKRKELEAQMSTKKSSKQ